MWTALAVTAFLFALYSIAMLWVPKADRDLAAWVTLTAVILGLFLLTTWRLLLP